MTAGELRTDDAVDLLDYDIVLTTYATLREHLLLPCSPCQPATYLENPATMQALTRKSGGKRARRPFCPKSSGTAVRSRPDFPTVSRPHTSWHTWPGSRPAVVFDESHLVPDDCVDLARMLASDLRWCVSGTPFGGGIQDLGPQMSILTTPLLCRTFFKSREM